MWELRITAHIFELIAWKVVVNSIPVTNYISLLATHSHQMDKITDAQVAELSESENPYGIEMRKARPLGAIFSLLTGTLFIVIFVSLIANFSILKISLLLFAFIPLGTSIKFTMSARESGQFKRLAQEAGLGLDSHQQSNSSEHTESVCRECREKISSDVNRCPHCGWKPKKRGGLWWGATAVMSFNPIGWALGAKGASDNIKARKGVSEEVPASSKDADSDESEEKDISPTEKLERINELKEQGAITEEEFEEKKKQLLDKI